jgi:hypothetical protein
VENLLYVKNYKDNMGRACGMNGEDEKCIQIFFGKPEGKKPFEDLGIDGKITSE